MHSDTVTLELPCKKHEFLCSESEEKEKPQPIAKNDQFRVTTMFASHYYFYHKNRIFRI